jgi:hypothetical protein
MNEVSNNSDVEQVFCNVSKNLEKYIYSDEEIKQALNLFTPSAGGHAGVVVANSSVSKYFSFPLIEFLYPCLKGINCSLLSSILVEFTFFNDLGAATLTDRIALSSTTASIWNATNIAFSSMAYRTSIERYQTHALLQVPRNPILMFDKFETKCYNVSWTDNTGYQKINLNADYTIHNRIQGLYVYVYGSALNTAYNTATAGTVVSSMGFQIKYKSQSMVDFSNATSHPIAKRNFINRLYRQKYDKLISSNFYDISTNTTQKYYVPLLYIDFNNLKVINPDGEIAITNFDNSVNDFKIIIYNTAGTNFGALSLYAMLHYIEPYQIQGKKVLKA